MVAWFGLRSRLVALEARVAQLEANDPARAAALVSASKQLQRHLERLRWHERAKPSDDDDDDEMFNELLARRGGLPPVRGEGNDADA